VTDQSTLDLVLAGTVFAATLGVCLFLYYRVRHRRAELAREAIPTRALRDDRAYNQIRITRTAAQRLQRSGFDVGGIPSLLDKAEAARQSGEVETAMAFAQSAHESLILLQASSPTVVPSVGPLHPAAPAPGAPSSQGAENSPTMSARTPPGPLPESTPSDTPSTPRRLPPNKAESRFQITLLTDDLQAASSAGGNPDATKEARTLLGDAQAAFDKGQYTEALRLSLKGRRKAGARIDSLPPSPGAVPMATEGDESPQLSPASGPANCSSCGQPLRANDQFCRGCGAPRKAARCGQCGQPLAGADRFCGACGAPIRT
jgi:Double zinc ribbon